MGDVRHLTLVRFIVSSLGCLACLCLSLPALGQDGIPTVMLPVANFYEVRISRIREAGKDHHEGWIGYYEDYRENTAHTLTGRHAGPYDTVTVLPYTLEMRWVGIVLDQDLNSASDEWAANELYNTFVGNYGRIHFNVFLVSDTPHKLAEENLRFVFQDSTGTQRAGDIHTYLLKETGNQKFRAVVALAVPIYDSPIDITWFSLRILNDQYAGRVAMKWEFLKD